MILDDNILKFMDRGDAIHANLDEMVARGFKEMRKAGAKTWSGSDSPNPAHWSEEVDVGNGLVWTPQLPVFRHFVLQHIYIYLYMVTTYIVRIYIYIYIWFPPWFLCFSVF